MFLLNIARTLSATRLAVPRYRAVQLSYHRFRLLSTATSVSATPKVVKATTKSRTKVATKLKPKVKPSPKAKKVEKKPAPRFKANDLRPPVRPPAPFANYIRTTGDFKPGTDVRVQFKAASERWRALTPEEKASYKPDPEKVAAYRTVYAEWKSGLSRPLRRAVKQRAQKRQLKRNPKVVFVPNGFMLFYTDYRSRDPEAGSVKIPTYSKQVAAIWRALPDSEKEMWQQKSRQLRLDAQTKAATTN